jgi:hypothetical protein
LYSKILITMRYLFTAFLFIVYFAAKAQQSPIMRCNPAGTACAPYYNLDSAIASANPGDMLYLPAGQFSINSPLTKKLNIIGAGAHADSSQATGITTITGDIDIREGASNSLLEGFYLTGYIRNYNAHAGDTCQGILFKRINIKGVYNNYDLGGCFPYSCAAYYIGFQNCLYLQCVFRESSVIASVSCTYKNCIIDYVDYDFGSVFDHCIFTGAVTNQTFYQLNTSQIKNSIFLIPAGNTGGGATVMLNNNLFMQGIANTTTILSNNANIDNASQACTNHFATCPAGFANNEAIYQLSNASSANNAADDGTDIGIFGGLSPFKMGMIPSNPHVYFKNIATSTNSSGNLPVNVKVRTEN